MARVPATGAAFYGYKSRQRDGFEFWVDPGNGSGVLRLESRLSTRWTRQLLGRGDRLKAKAFGESANMAEESGSCDLGETDCDLAADHHHDEEIEEDVAAI